MPLVLDHLVAYLVLTAVRLFKARRARTWPTATAQVQAVYESITWGGPARNITFIYRWDEKLHTGTHRKVFIWDSSAKQYSAGFPIGTEIVIRVKPGDPAASVMVDGDQNGASREINRINIEVTPDAPRGSSFTKWNAGLIILGSLILVLALIGTLFPPEAPLRQVRNDLAVTVPDAGPAMDSPTEITLRAHLALQTDKAFEEPESLQPNIQETVGLAIQRLELVQTYSSRLIVTGTTESSSMQARLDFVKPDRLHMIRSVAGSSDEWVRTGERRFHMAPPSLPTDSEEWETMERMASIEEALDLLRRKPRSAASYRIQGKRYLRLSYDDGSELWIELSTKLVSKLETATATSRVQHAFAAFDDAMAIGDPMHENIAFHP